MADDPCPDPEDFLPTGKKPDDEKKKQDFVDALAKCWVETDKGKALWLLEKDKDWSDILPKIQSKKATADDVKAHLLASYTRDTAAFKKNGMVRAWMHARVNELRYHQAGYRRFGNFWPSYEVSKAHKRETADVPAPIKDPDSIKIAPGLATFLTAVNQKFGKFKASNYPGHLTVFDMDQGMSVDIYLTKKTKDGLWWDVAEAVKFMKTVDDTAGTADFKGTKWTALYDHFDVADQINKSAKQGQMRFRANGSTYHGPDPALLHIHLEVVVPSDKTAPK
jgi:hypothetical protein